MKQQREIDKKVEQALNSLDGIRRAEAQPWLFARVTALLQKESEEEKTPWGTVSSILARPVVAVAGLFLILFLNGMFLFKQEENKAGVVLTEELQPSDSESLIASSSSFEYENLVQP